MKLEQLFEYSKCDPRDLGNPVKDSGVDQTKNKGSNLPNIPVTVSPVKIKGKDVSHSAKPNKPVADRKKEDQKGVRKATNNKAVLYKKDKEQMQRELEKSSDDKVK